MESNNEPEMVSLSELLQNNQEDEETNDATTDNEIGLDEDAVPLLWDNDNNDEEDEGGDAGRTSRTWWVSTTWNPGQSNSDDANPIPSTSSGPPPSMSVEDWVNVPEFIPQAFAANVQPDEGAAAAEPRKELCDICGVYDLRPVDRSKRKSHRRLCGQLHEGGLEATTEAVERSKDKMCGICLDIVLNKPPEQRRFGILSGCRHCFCLECIRTWRSADLTNKIVKTCPECRTESDFICPSIYWVNTEEEKNVLIARYKQVLAGKPCKYFRYGFGSCQFGNKCFYLHASPNGMKIDAGPPRRFPPLIPPHVLIPEVFNNGLFQQMTHWDPLPDNYDTRWLIELTTKVEYLMGLLSDSDESDWSDHDVF